MAKASKINSSRQYYLDQFEILACSGIGVIMTHAREPYRVCEVLHEWADKRRRPYKEWNVRDGWLEWKLPTSKHVSEPVADGTTEATKALFRIQDVLNKGADEWTDGVFAMVYPHWIIPKNPAFIQCLKLYVQRFSKTKQRLILVVPEGFSLPKELENDIVVLDLELPKREELRSIYLDVVSAAFEHDKDVVAPFNDDQVDSILSIGAGMTEMEFETAISRAIISNKVSFPKTPLNDFTRVISTAKVEVVKRSEVLELMEPVALEDVGGLDLYKAWIIKRKSCFSKSFREFCNGKDIPKGVVLIGPPGTGKTMVGKATSSVLEVPFFRFDVGKVFGSLVGQSEERVRSALKLLTAMAPCVAMIDEVDKAGLDPREGGGDGGTAKRVMGSILTFMQDSTDPIFWILTANRIRNLPPEMLRKGRLDEVFSVQPPNVIERREIVRIHLLARNQKPDEMKDLEVAIQSSEGFVSAELEAAIKEAVVDSFHSGEPITGASIASQLKNMKPISVAFKEDFEAMAQWASDNARPASSAVEDEPVRSRRRLG